MFENAKERLRKLEETNETVRKISQHVQNNKTTYIAAPIFLATGFIGGKYLQRPITIDFQPVITNSPVFNNTIIPVMKSGELPII
jgi:hypothetical protein